MGGVEPWLMARWKARVEFLLSVIGLHLLSLAVEALQGKRCQDSLLSGGVGQFERRFQGKGSSPGNIFLVSTKLDTFCYPKCKLHRATCRRFDTIPACDRRTDGRTDGIGIASTALAMRALRRAVKNHTP